MFALLRDGSPSFQVFYFAFPAFQQAILNCTDSNLSNRSLSSDHDDLVGRRKRALASPDSRGGGTGEGAHLVV